MPKFKSAGDVIKYTAFKALDGLGAAGSGQIAKSAYGALLKMGWIQNVTINGAAQIVSSEVGLLGVIGPEITVTQTAVLEPVA